MARLLANGHTLRAFDHAFLHRERAFQSDARRPRSHDAALFSLARALVFFTGFCEIAGAVGLLFSLTRRAAGFALILFFIAVFPANVRAARSAVTLRGKPATALWLRAPCSSSSYSSRGGSPANLVSMHTDVSRNPKPEALLR